jgi:D-serine deaminase-like pyridoxal phosphate-dependent protein
MEPDLERYEQALADVEPPFAFVDLDAFDAAAESVLHRARGKALRVETSALRCRALQQRLVDRDDAFRGLLTYSLPETLWLHGLGADDLLLGEPTADRRALAELGLLQGAGRPIVTVDSAEQLDLIEAAAAPVAEPIRVAIELDAGAVRLPAEAAALARDAAARPSFELSALVGPAAPEGGRRGVARDLAERREASADAVSAVAGRPLMVCAAGPGALEAAAEEDAVTELALGADFLADAMFFAMPVVRRGEPGGPRIGDRAVQRPAEPGELCERFDVLQLVSGGKRAGEAPTYRGEGRAFV